MLKRKGHNEKQEKDEMGGLTGKSKHTVKVGNHVYTNMKSKSTIETRGEHKGRLLEMHLK